MTPSPLFNEDAARIAAVTSIESGSKCTVSGLRMRTKREQRRTNPRRVVRDNAEIPQASFRRAADGGIVGNGCVVAVLMYRIMPCRTLAVSDQTRHQQDGP